VTVLLEKFFVLTMCWPEQSLEHYFPGCYDELPTIQQILMRKIDTKGICKHSRILVLCSI